MTYYVTYRIDARYIAEVEADSLEEAKIMAEDEFYNADFGHAEDIEAEQVCIEDENGNFLWER